MRRIISALCGVMLAFTQASATELELIKPGEMIVATEGTCPPYSMSNGKGGIDGLEYRMFTEVAKRLGLKYKPVVIPWDGILVGLMSSRFDIVSTPVDITPERQKKVLFVDAWLEYGGKILSRKGSDLMKGSDIKGKKIGVLVSSTWEKLAREYDPGEVVPFKTITDCVQALLDDRIDGMVLNSLEAAYAAKHATKPLEVSEEYLNNIQVGWAVKMGNKNLVMALNKVLAEMMADGTYQRICIDLIGYDPRPQNQIKSILNHSHS